jgi:hypothetical protein
MATKVVPLNLRPGQDMSWLISSQAANTIVAELKDSSQTYCRYTSSQMGFHSITGHHTIDGEDLRLEIEIKEASKILMAESTGELVTTPGGEVVGYTRAYGFEDSSDSDFNDLMVSIITNKKIER